MTGDGYTEAARSYEAREPQEGEVCWRCQGTETLRQLDGTFTPCPGCQPRYTLDLDDELRSFIDLDDAIKEADRLMSDDPERYGSIAVFDEREPYLWLCVMDEWTRYRSRR